jgi:hypothetical protein
MPDAAEPSGVRSAAEPQYVVAELFAVGPVADFPGVAPVAELLAVGPVADFPGVAPAAALLAVGPAAAPPDVGPAAELLGAVVAAALHFDWLPATPVELSRCDRLAEAD